MHDRLTFPRERRRRLRILRGLTPAVLAVLPLLAGPAGAQLQCSGGTIAFHPDGGIERCQIEGQHRLHTADGWVTCANGHIVVLHPNGKLANCTLAEAAQLGGAQCPPGSRAAFGDNGSFVRCE